MTASASSLARFDSKLPETWPTFIRRFEFHISARGNITDEQRKGMLLEALDDRAVDRLQRWMSPIPLSTATYAALLATLKVKMSPNVNTTVKYGEFTTRRQQPGESAAEYCERLSFLSSLFGVEEESVRDLLCMHQFIIGMSDTVLQDKMFALEDCTLQKALDLAMRYEVTKKVSADLRSHSESILKVSSQDPQGSDKRGGARRNTPPVCYYCAGSHMSLECKADRSKLHCDKCKATGHVSQVCKGGSKKKRGGKGPKGKGQGPPKDDGKQAPSSNVACLTEVHPPVPSTSRPTSSGLASPLLPLPMPLDEGCWENFDSEGLYCTSASQEEHFPPIIVPIKLHGKSIDFQLDCGAGRALIGWPAYKGLPDPPALLPLPTLFHAWDSAMTIHIAGYFPADVEHKGVRYRLPLVVAKGDGPALLGRNWFKPLGFAITGVNNVSDVSAVLKMVQSYPAVSSPTVGCYRGPPVHIDVDPTKAPKYHRRREVKLPLITKMSQAIDSNVARGIWVPTSHSRWASGIVPVPKKNGSLRLCADYKHTINPAIQPDPYKSPSVDEVICALGGGKFYAEIDLAEAYTQIPVDDETAQLLTVNTIKGLFKVTRLPFGVKIASAIFQRVMDGLLGSVAGVICYQDNIYLRSSSLPEHIKLLRQVLSIISEAGFTVNADKCTWVATELNVLGYKVSEQGVHPLEDKVAAIKNAPAPEDVEQLQSILGLLSFYGRFFLGKAHVIEPLHRLLDSGAEWNWGPQHDRALEVIKERITSDQVLIHYSLDLPVSITCDASSYGVGAVLSHTVRNPATGQKEERPVAFASRTLSKTERRYSQLDKEALAIMYGVKKFARYLHGRKFRVITDHKPLLGLFNPAAPVPEHLSPRMTRWALALAAMDCIIVHKPGAEIGNADFLSRLPLQASGGPLYPEPVGVHLLEAQLPDALTAAKIAEETEKDPLLGKILDWTVNGWPAAAPVEATPYAQKKDSISTLNGCLLYADRVIIPPSLRSQVIDLIHATHPGITCSKAIAESIAWWPRINADVSNAVKFCQQCQLAARAPPRQQYSPWPAAQRPWERVHLDYAGPFLGHHFLIAIDAYSKWPVIKMVPNLSSKVLVSTLRDMFADFGKPREMVTDNGRSFIAEETRRFLELNGVRLLHSPPWHPASNGLAERTVQTFKLIMGKLKDGDVRTRLARTQWAMRTRPSATTGKTPAQLFVGRDFRTHITSVHPKDQVHPHCPIPANPFCPGQKVWALKHTANSTYWVPGSIQRLNAARSCDVVLEDGSLMANMHVNHLRRRELPTAVPADPPLHQACPAVLDSPAPAPPLVAAMDFEEDRQPREQHREVLIHDLLTGDQFQVADGPQQEPAAEPMVAQPALAQPAVPTPAAASPVRERAFMGFPDADPRASQGPLQPAVPTPAAASPVRECAFMGFPDAEPRAHQGPRPEDFGATVEDFATQLRSWARTLTLQPPAPEPTSEASAQRSRGRGRGQAWERPPTSELAPAARHSRSGRTIKPPARFNPN